MVQNDRITAIPITEEVEDVAMNMFTIQAEI